MSRCGLQNLMTKFVAVCTTDEIPVGEGRSFEVENRSIAIFNNGGKFSAIDDMCPHMGASLAEGHFYPYTCNVDCPRHAWRFNVNDGAWADNPRVKTDIFEVRVTNDEIHVGIPPTNKSEHGDDPITPSDN